MNTRISKSILFSLLVLPSVGVAKELPGLWMGIAEMTHVNEVHCQVNDKNQCADGTDIGEPKAVKYPFNLQVVLHMDSAKNTRLLREVYVMQTKEQVVLGKNNSGEDIKGNKRVLVTKEERVQDFDGITRRGDNKLVPVRLVTPSFDFPVIKTTVGGQAQYGFQDSILLDGVISDVDKAAIKTKGKISYADDHPTNPFRHQFHPHHTKGRSVQRTMTITLNGLVNNDTGKLTGIYEETIEGLHKQAIKLRGDIQLTKVNDITTLNPDKNGGE